MADSRASGAIVLAGLLWAVSAFGQSFEAASVKPADPKLSGRIIPPSGGPGTSDPNRVTFTNAVLKSVLARAYDVRTYQIEGPAWLDSERYTIEAVLPPDTTVETYRLMLRNLLADRFHLVLHHQPRMFQGYELGVGKNGLKIQESVVSAGSENVAPGHAWLVSDEKGRTTLDRPGLVVSVRFGEDGLLSRVTGRYRPISDLANMLNNILHQPVLDGTDLPGNYDFDFEFTANPTPGVAGIDIFTALREQCGLKLEARKMSLDMIVIDRGDKVPAGN
jgi:uncharacterized protein (TIGR03435 family)